MNKPKPSSKKPKEVKTEGGKTTKPLRDAEVEARELVALVNRKKPDIADEFYDIGEALGRLSDRSRYVSLGYASFALLVRDELGMSPVTARRLVGVARELTRARAISLGPTRAFALLDLARATKDTESIEDLAKKKVRVPNQKEPVVVSSLSAREIQRLAKSTRATDETSGEDDEDLLEARRWVTRADGILKKRDPAAEVSLVTLRKKGENLRRELRIACSFDARAILDKLASPPRKPSTR